MASAVTDPECRTLFASDIKLMSNSNVLDEISEWRQSKGYPEMAIRDICELVGGRRRR